MASEQERIDALLIDLMGAAPLSRGERQDLQLALKDASSAEFALWRARAFELARGSLADRPEKSLEWLEDVMQALIGHVLSCGTSDRNEALVCFSPGTDCLETITRRLENAERTADLCVFTITDDRISRVIDAAHRRGVVVRIVSDNEKSSDLGSDIAQLAEAGVQVRTDRSPAHMHHKFAVLDGKWLLNGSYNWTRGAAAENRENLVVTDDPRLIKAFQNEFETLWRQLA